MLSGLTSINLDAKGRLAIPTRYRAHLEEVANGKIMATVHPDICLMIYPINEWTNVQRQLSKLSNMEPMARDLQRLLLGYASELEMDSNGRVLLPSSLRDFAHLNKHAVLVGVGNKFELWDEQRWNERRNTWIGTDTTEGSLSNQLNSLIL